ncbi:MAG: hypothetical protein ABI900_11800 [Betaproteobacteria bacterium]
MKPVKKGRMRTGLGTLGVRLLALRLLGLVLQLSLMQTLGRSAIRLVQPGMWRIEIVGDYVPESRRRARRLLGHHARVRGLRADKRNRTYEDQGNERFHLDVTPA